MPYEIKSSPDFAMIDYTLAPGESVVAESGAMVSMSSNIKMKTEARGGIFAAAKRKLLGGESIFQNTFTAEGGEGRVQLAPGSPGDIISFDLAEGKSLMIQSSAYVAATPDVKLDTKWGGVKGFFSGTGMFLLKATGPGTVFVASYGAIYPKNCVGEYIVDTDHIVAFEDTVDYSVTKVGGIKSLFFGGEGLVAKFSGNGMVYAQTRSPGQLASFLHPYRPVKNNN
ncbi:MAG: TIGR00266 family protein [Deltaproteobacteria bacterium]|nr:TIGR00266 family protein [Deltaproteobacteria bacterium]MBN2672716.1 TIGR00266 family protein [Deltaproteobacteria bacterium]